MWIEIIDKMSKTLALILLFSLLVLNIFDCICTIVLASIGVQEANPLMSYLLDYDNTLFVVVKLFLVFLGSLLLYKYRDYKIAKYGIYMAVVFYLIVLCVHLLLLF